MCPVILSCHTDFHTSGEEEVDLGVIGGGGEIEREPQDSDKVRVVRYSCHVVWPHCGTIPSLAAGGRQQRDLG